MSVSVDNISLQPLATPITAPPPPKPAVGQVGERAGARDDRRNFSKGEQARSPLDFRALLGKSGPGGAGAPENTQRVHAETAPTHSYSESLRTPRRADKLPDTQPEVLSSTEAAGLYRTAQSSAAVSDVPASQFQAATSRYARSFFSVSGTFARPGESLELTA